METMFLGIVVFLFLLAIFDLVVGVSNDAVNFMNSAIGAKAASFKTIIAIAAFGIFIGATLSNGMMEIARHGIFRPDAVCRLMPQKGTIVVGLVHPAFKYPYEDKYIEEYILHHTYDNWDQYGYKVNRYTTLAAEKYRKDGKSVSFVKDIVLRPIWAFFKIYILNLGFLDGKLGFIFSMNHYIYTMMKYTKLYYLYKSDGKL